MPCTPEAVDVLRKANVLIAPSMAAGVGGVSIFFYLFYPMSSICALNLFNDDAVSGTVVNNLFYMGQTYYVQNHFSFIM